MTPTVQHHWQLECWGRGWAWEGCEGASDGWGNVSLVPLKQRAVEVTWVWPEWSDADGEVMPPPGPSDADLRYQVEYGPLNAPFMLGRVGGSSRGVTLEEGVEPFTTYEVKLTTDAMANTSAIFFQIVETVTEKGSGRVRAEEVLLVILVLVLWAVAILLFFHRWGKIRMLEPYQPEYKALNHSPACPLAPTTPTQTQPRPQNAKPLLPRKSSSLCFTPSMLRTVHVPPPACRISVPHIDQTPLPRCSRAAHQSPASHVHLTRHRLRLASDSMDHSTGRSHDQVEVSRKVRSAENLRHYRIASTYCRGYSEESAVHGTQPGLGEGLGVPHNPLARRRSCQSQSLDLEHYRSPTPGPQEAVARGRSLDSTSVTSLRRSPTAGPSSAGAEPVCTTPELRVSPTPPDITTHHPHTHIVLQRQETIMDDTTLFQVPYATLMEEELENDA
ncbi:hypothetical protein O3P69_007545 [Scylla paramamosain]|uniref:Fibronectin type III domain-containing protein n=1 Tax=Scylla paramamosain TaxID=85552 RepID=A0AAW0UW81_SCYPA